MGSTEIERGMMIDRMLPLFDWPYPQGEFLLLLVLPIRIAFDSISLLFLGYLSMKIDRQFLGMMSLRR